RLPNVVVVREGGAGHHLEPAVLVDHFPEAGDAVVEVGSAEPARPDGDLDLRSTTLRLVARREELHEELAGLTPGVLAVDPDEGAALRAVDVRVPGDDGHPLRLVLLDDGD